MRYLLLLSFFIYSFSGFCQDVYIPERMTFANMELTLSESVRKVLKSEVEAIKRNPKYFNLKVERANLYFPIIEKIFREENFPEDFKYLSLQESSLVSDAVSSSNAVGYWQFKKESAQEVGLRVDNEVDERMNIVSSTRGAARYLRKNNSILDNWIYALLSYNLGPGGVRSHVDNKNVGSRRMVIDKHMHWYVIRFLAHKIAYENEVGKAEHPELKLVEYTQGAKKSLKDISKETEISSEELEMYNKWLLKSKVPDDKVYAVILPVKKDASQHIVSSEPDYSVPEPANESPDKQEKPKREKKRRGLFSRKVEPDNIHQTIVNRLKAIQAKEGESFKQLAERGGIGLIDILKYNELGRYDKPVAGEFYYLQPKRGRALVIMHTVEKGEELWDVAHKYGVRIKAIKRKNRMDKYERLKEGRVLWLRNKMPKDAPVQYVKKEKKIINKSESKSAEHKTVEIETTEVKEVEDKKQTTINENIPDVKEVSTISSHSEATEVVEPEYKEDIKPFEPEVPTYVNPVSTEKKNKYHIVEPGETVYGISRKYSIPADSIIVWNSLVNTSLKSGQRIIVEKGNADSIQEEPIIKIHVAEQGDTIYKISRLYGVSVTDIMEWNQKQDFNISVGEKITIKK